MTFEQALQAMREGKIPSLEELHHRAYESLDREDNFNYGEDVTIHWRPVAKSEKDIAFEKQMAKLKWMKEFNRGR